MNRLPALAAFFVVSSCLSYGEGWSLTTAPVTNWVALASSSDGHQLVAAAGGAAWSGVAGPIFISTNEGTSWLASSAPVTEWTSVASSANGQMLIAADAQGPIYISTNAGTTWQSNAQSPSIVGNWKALACSADGGIIIAGSAWLAGEAYGGQISISKDSGATWNTTFSQGYLTCVACSADGRTMLVGLDAANPAPLAISTNWGTTWQSAPVGAVYAIGCSGDGTKIIANNWRGNGIVLSMDSGGTWTPNATSGVVGNAVAVSENGSTMMAAPSLGPIFVSRDSGATWSTNSSPVMGWGSLTSSADGSTLVAAVNGGGIYTWHSTKVAPGTVLWSYDAGSPIGSTPAEGPDGTVYFGTAGSFYAITNQGSSAFKKWAVTIPYECSSPAVAANGTVYVAAMDSGTPATGYLYSLNPDGSTNWNYYIQGNGSPAIGFDNTVYVHGLGRLYALAANGIPKWNVVIGGEVTFGTPSIAPDGTIYITSPDSGSFSAFNTDGALKWSSVANLGRGDSPAIAADGTVYLVGSGLFAYRPDGSSPWSHQGQLYAPASLAKDGTIYVAGSTAFGFEYGLSLDAYLPNGVLVWQVQTNLGADPHLAQTVGTPAVDASGNLYVAALNTLFAFSPGGRVLWAFTPGDGASSLTSATLGSNGTIYASFGSKIYAVASGNTLGDTPWPTYHQNLRHTGKMERPTITQPQKRADGSFQFQLYPNQIGQTYTVETSTNLKTWSNLMSFAATISPTNIVDLSATNTPLRFYRANSASQ